MKKLLNLVILLVLSGCSVFLPVNVPAIQSYQISINHDMASECEDLSGRGDIQISRLKADEPYDSDDMFYSLAPYQLSHYSRNKWVAPPSAMITKAIQEKLMQSCEYAHVVNADFLTASEYRLNSQLIELQQNIRNNQTEVVLAMLEQLVNNKTNQVVKSKTFVVKVATSANLHGYVMGVNQAMDKFLGELLMWLK